MSEREEQFTDCSRFPWIVCFLELPIVYVLGIGPAAWVYHVVAPPEPISDFLVWVYRPLE